MEEIARNIDKEIKAKKKINRKINKTYIAKKLGYKNAGGLTQALQRGTLRVEHFIKIADILNIKPSDLFPRGEEWEFFNMPLIDLIRVICKNEIEKYLNKDGKGKQGK